jgi:radical SAM-linked protein
VNFTIRGNLRFLSHAETVRVFQRAFVRAGINICYSKGFNPHPRMSLPLPRSVGVESDAELLVLQIEKTASMPDNQTLKSSLGTQLPLGCEITGLCISESRVSFQPAQFTCVLTVRKEYNDQRLHDRIDELLKTEQLEIQRRIDAKGSTRYKDVRGFLKSIELQQDSVVVNCNIDSNGTIRFDEIMSLLELDVEKLSSPMRKADVVWKNN